MAGRPPAYQPAGQEHLQAAGAPPRASFRQAGCPAATDFQYGVDGDHDQERQKPAPERLARHLAPEQIRHNRQARPRSPDGAAEEP